MYGLGVDLGTTFTAAAVNVGGRVEMLGLGNRALQVPSVLFVRADGEVLVGEAAERRGVVEPGRVVREFKRRIGDPVPLVVGGAPFSAQALAARLLGWVVGVATERLGSQPGRVTVTHPANWGPFKYELLRQAIALAGLRDVQTCTEPAAAAIAYASRTRVGQGERIAVYDLGGGTFDAAVLARDGDGFVLLGSPEGIEHLGGIDFDAAVFHHVLTALGDAAGGLDERDQATVVGLARLRRDCVEAKEALSADTETVIPVVLPRVNTSVRLTRGEFEDMLRPAIADTVSALHRALASAHTQPADLTAIVLVGGSSRIPLVSEQLFAAFGRPLALDTHPKHDIALGAAIRTPTPATGPAYSGPALTTTAPTTTAPTPRTTAPTPATTATATATATKAAATAPAGTAPDDRITAAAATTTAGDTAEAMIPAPIPAPVDPAATDNHPTPAGAAPLESVTTVEAVEATNEHRSGMPTGIPPGGGTPAATPGTPAPTPAATAGEGREDGASKSAASRRRLRVRPRLGLVIALAAVLVVSVLGTALTRLGPRHPANVQQAAAEIPVPVVAGSGAAALNTLRAAGFDVRTATMKDRHVPKGQVLRTDPPAGAKVLPHSIVTLVVSDGPGTVAVPKISGTEADARRALAAAGLQVKVLTEGSETVPKDQVTRVEPKAGSSVQPGSVVTVYISTGTSSPTGPTQAEKVKVPSVQGLSEGDARKALQQQGFQVRLDHHYNADVAAGQVIGTVPAGGTPADKGSPVVLDVSRGPRETTLSPACSISPQVGGPGDAVEVNCQGFTAKDTVSVAWNGNTIGSGTADDRGNVTIPATIPSGFLGAGYPGRTWELHVSGHAGGSTSVFFKNAPEPSPSPSGG